MRYDRIKKGTFLERPNRFIAYVEIDGGREKVHVKNTGRLRELLWPGVTVHVQEASNSERSTKWDLIAVEKEGRTVNIDSQIPNVLAREWIEGGNLLGNVDKIRPECKYGNSRIDLYVETGERKILVEVKGVTLEDQGVVRFPDAPSERAVKHVKELSEAVKAGYEAYVLLVIQLSGARYFTPNMDTHPAFGEALMEAQQQGVNVIAVECDVEPDRIEVKREVPVVLQWPGLYEMAGPIVEWYRKNRRDLPWRSHVSAYRVWVSEIMLQQTRVEAVKPYYERFISELPGVRELSEVPEDRLLKLWEGLGYYNRVRNMQKAAQQIMELHGGEFPRTYEEIRSLKGIGNYTAGAISSFAYGLQKPAVDGNVLRVVSRILASEEDIMKESVRKKYEAALEKVIPEDASSDFNQGLIELGAIVCVPNGMAKCEICPVFHLCQARKKDIVMQLPVKKKAKDRRTEDKTVFIFKDGEAAAVRKRPSKGLLAGMYELPNTEGSLNEKEAIAYCKNIGLTPVRLKKLPPAKHIFSHVEWHMTGYEVVVDELEKTNNHEFLFAKLDEIKEKYPMPSAFESFKSWL